MFVNVIKHWRQIRFCRNLFHLHYFSDILTALPTTWWVCNTPLPRMHYFLPFLWLKEGMCAQLWNSITKFFLVTPLILLMPDSAANFGQVSSSAWVQKDSTEVRHILVDSGYREYKRSCIVTWLSGTEQRKCTSYVYQFHRVLLGCRIVKSSLPVSYFPASEHGEHSRWDKTGHIQRVEGGKVKEQ